jgi:UDP-N-acetyl-D-glucosamine dehydrogenase
MSISSELKKKIEEKNAVCGIIGLGYVGLPLAIELAEAGFKVKGIDKDPEKIAELKSGGSYIPDVESARVKAAVAAGTFEVTADFSVLAGCDTANICVPTPLSKTRDPDISYIVGAMEELKSQLHPGMMILLESTTYPGSTEEIVVPVMKEAGLTVGEDVFVAFSPERVDPGNPTFDTSNIPRVVGGISESCRDLAVAFYRTIIPNVHPVSSTTVAEMIKLLENTFRSVNIGLVNELALMCDQMHVDVWEVIEGAATKPFGFMPFYPGPGLGGHCIPVDPFYLSWKARSVGFEARFIELAGQVNSFMPQHVVRKAFEALNSAGRSVSGSRILVLGVAYKKDIDDVRESPAYDIVSELLDRGAEIVYCDGYVPSFSVEGRDIEKVEFTEAELAAADLAVIVTDHSNIDYQLLLNKAGLILDTRNAIKERSEKVWRI